MFCDVKFFKKSTNLGNTNNNVSSGIIWELSFSPLGHGNHRDPAAFNCPGLSLTGPQTAQMAAS